MRKTIKKTIEVEVNITVDYLPEKTYPHNASDGGPGHQSEPAECRIVSIELESKEISNELNKQNFDFMSLESDLLSEIEN